MPVTNHVPTVRGSPTATITAPGDRNLPHNFPTFVHGHQFRSVVNDGRDAVTNGEIGFIVLIAIDTITLVNALDININVDLCTGFPIFFRTPADLNIIEPVKGTFYFRSGSNGDCFLSGFPVWNSNAETHADGL